MRPNNDLASLIVAHLYALLSVARFIANPSETIRRVFVHRTEALFVGKPMRFVCLLRKFEGDIDVVVVRLPGVLVIPCGSAASFCSHYLGLVTHRNHCFRSTSRMTPRGFDFASGRQDTSIDMTRCDSSVRDCASIAQWKIFRKIVVIGVDFFSLRREWRVDNS